MRLHVTELEKWVSKIPQTYSSKFRNHMYTMYTPESYTHLRMFNWLLKLGWVAADRGKKMK